MSRVHERYRQTDRQTTDGSATSIAERNVVTFGNVTWIQLKTGLVYLFIYLLIFSASVKTQRIYQAIKVCISRLRGIEAFKDVSTQNGLTFWTTLCFIYIETNVILNNLLNK